MNGFRSQLSVALGSAATCKRSKVSVKAAIQPITPVMMRFQAKPLLGLGRGSDEVFTVLTVSVLHGSLVTF